MFRFLHAYLYKHVEVAFSFLFNYLKPRTCLNYGMVILNSVVGDPNNVLQGHRKHFRIGGAENI